MMDFEATRMQTRLVWQSPVSYTPYPASYLIQQAEKIPESGMSHPLFLSRQICATLLSDESHFFGAAVHLAIASSVLAYLRRQSSIIVRIRIISGKETIANEDGVGASE